MRGFLIAAVMVTIGLPSAVFAQRAARALAQLRRNARSRGPLMGSRI